MLVLLLVVVVSAVATLWAPNTKPPVNNNMAKQRHFMQAEQRTGDEAPNHPNIECSGLDSVVAKRGPNEF